MSGDIRTATWVKKKRLPASREVKKYRLRRRGAKTRELKARGGRRGNPIINLKRSARKAVGVVT